MGRGDGQVWRLERRWGQEHGRELVGEIAIAGFDFPWLSGRFTPQPAFAVFKPWFDEARAVLAEEDFERFDEVYASIARRLTLVSPTGPVAEFLLHIEGDEARFRWSDTPFEP
ncbi:hypothetical protein AB0B01_03725 [Streptomyces sp. NPDC044571]|uniref:hypothetical protein n=1 Tax=Streptomyces sp. NPDC044571 TaxID=3155371 RepID=UPI0033DDB8F7